MKIQEFGKHLDEPREIGKKKEKVSSKDKMMAKKQIGESLGITTEQAKQILDNICVECGNIANENLRKWFKDKWVNIGKKDKSGKHPPCGTSGKKRAYAKCVPASKARSMSKKDKESATRRKRAAQNKANRGGKQSAGQGKAPIRVSTKPKKQENKMSSKLEELVGKPITEAQFDEAAGKKDACYHKVKARYDVWPSAYASGALVKCRKVGAKNWGNKSKKESTNVWLGENEIYWENSEGYGGYTFEFHNEDLNEAEYQGRKVKLGKIMQGDVKKFKVYVKNPKGNVVKVNFGQGGDAKGGTMRIRKSNPKARANFRARHNCDNPGPRHKARYWSCRKWQVKHENKTNRMVS